MKNLKLGLFSLLAILALSVFLTSCDQTEIIDVEENTEANFAEADEVITFMLPETMNDKPEDEIISFVENLSEEEIKELSETHPVDEIDSRSCGNWSLAYSYSTFLYSYGFSPKYCVYRLTRVYRRWCGPPTNGGYQYYTQYSYYTRRC